MRTRDGFIILSMPSEMRLLLKGELDGAQLALEDGDGLEEDLCGPQGADRLNVKVEGRPTVR